MLSLDSSWLIILLMMVQGFSLTRAEAFTEKMEKYYGLELRYEMHYFSNKWYAATVYSGGVCTSRVYLSDQFLGGLGEDDLWKGVLAHEWAHVLQGSRCADNEREADCIALNKLLEAGELSAYFRYSQFLQERWSWTQEEVYGCREH